MWRIQPYRTPDGWLFDHPELGISREAFVAGADTLIELTACGADRIELGFSDQPLPGADELVFLRSGAFDAAPGSWYHSRRHGLDAWLCDTLLSYFDAPPARIYVSTRSV